MLYKYDKLQKVIKSLRKNFKKCKNSMLLEFDLNTAMASMKIWSEINTIENIVSLFF